MHLLRNCISHGIETKEERIALGKKPEGEIFLKLGKLGKNISIDIGDDGRGINVEKIKKVILKRGLLKEEDLNKMRDHEIISYIFIPGFSTADYVSRISGQGIGMDVVRDVVSHLGGSVEVNSELGKGTSIKMILPINLSTINGLLIHLDTHPYIVPVSFCQSIMRIRQEQIKEVGGRKSIITEYGALPLFDLNKLVSNNITDKEGTSYEILILRLGKDIGAFIVGGLSEKQEFIIKQLPAGIRSSVLSGCSILSAGDIAYLINVQELFTKHILTMLEMRATNTNPEEQKKQSDKTEKKILLIDDSLTSRTVEKNILVSYGFNVDVASDGMEGFEMLAASHYDLVITDIEMPRMNGFALIEKVRKTAGLQNIPIFVVTTLDSEQDRKQGLDAGADAYIVKTGLGEESLISMISRYISPA
jgi:two-component system, chemotaxis family, sensor kinase CheA